MIYVCDGDCDDDNDDANSGTYCISDNVGYSQILNVFEFEPTAYNLPFGWNSAQRTACTSSNDVTATNLGRFVSFCCNEKNKLN